MTGVSSILWSIVLEFNSILICLVIYLDNVLFVFSIMLNKSAALAGY